MSDSSNLALPSEGGTDPHLPSGPLARSQPSAPRGVAPPLRGPSDPTPLFRPGQFAIKDVPAEAIRYGANGKPFVSWRWRKERLRQQRRDQKRRRRARIAKERRESLVILQHARTFGEVQWMCPLCGNLNAAKPAKKDGKLECRRCGKRLRVGIWVRQRPEGVPPYNAVFADVKIGHAANRIGEMGVRSDRPLLGRLAGTVHWMCEACRTWHGSGHFAHWETGLAVCATCGQRVQLTLILYRATSHHGLPYDWVPPRSEYVAKWIDKGGSGVSVAEATGQKRRWDRARAGGDESAPEDRAAGTGD